MWSKCASGGFVCLYIGIVWFSVEGIKCGVSVQLVALLCLYIGIVWLWVEGIKCGVSVQQVALCVCVSALCCCE